MSSELLAAHPEDISPGLRAAAPSPQAPTRAAVLEPGCTFTGGDIKAEPGTVFHVSCPAGCNVDPHPIWGLKGRCIGQGGFPAAEYPRQPSEMWTGVWVVPADAQPGALSYTVTATDRFNRTATFSPFINLASQIAIVE